MTPREHARALLAELEAATWATYPEDRERIAEAHFRQAMTGVAFHHTRNREYDAERRAIAARVAADPNAPEGLKT